MSDDEIEAFDLAITELESHLCAVIEALRERSDIAKPHFVSKAEVDFAGAIFYIRKSLGSLGLH